MKTKITFTLALLISILSYAQQGINYKAVIKDGTGTIVANDLIQVQFRIFDGATNVYEEIHAPTTDDNGIIILNIGEGAPVSGSFSGINWSSNNHFLNVQINSGSGLQDMGTTAFKTVPYALMAKDVENKIWTQNGTKINYLDGNVGVGLSNPVNTFSVLQPIGSANTVRIESLTHPIGKDLLELQIPTGSTVSSQFIEMQNGFDIVAAINGDGSAKFKSVQFEDNTTQVTAAKGPIAYGFIQTAGNTTSGSGNYTSTWVAASNRYEITITDEDYFWTLYTTNVTGVSSAIDKLRTDSANGKLVVYLYDSAGTLIQGNFQFITFK